LIPKIIFWSSVEAGIFMRATVDSIRDIGMQAEHRFAISSDTYRRAKTPLDRILLRLRMYIEYPIRLAWFCLIDRGPRILVVTTNTFYAPLIAAVFSGRGQLVIHLVWDLFPDALITDGQAASNGWLIRCVKGVVQQIFSRVSANVFLGQRLLEHAKTRFRQIPKSHVIPVGANAQVFTDIQITLLEFDTPVDILYCGNLGYMHDKKTLIEALECANNIEGVNSGFVLTFHASGPHYLDFKRIVSTIDNSFARNVRLESALSDAEWIDRMKEAHVALVTMKPGAEKVVMPSKTYSALAAGQAILAVCPLDSDLAQLVINEKCGWVVTPGRPDELISALNEISTERDLLFKKRKNAYQVGQLKYSGFGVAQKWIKLINNLEK
jgi:colanic acid biosynthesis glycosyl transferase WcaI